LRFFSIRLLAQALLLVGSGFVLTLLVLPAEENLWKDARLVAANAIPIIVLLFLVIAICGRLFVGMGMVALMLAALRYIHDSKIEILEIPLLSGDAQLVGQLFVSPDMVLEYLSGPVIAGAFCLILIVCIVFFYEAPVARTRHRFIALAILVVALLPFRSALAVHYTDLPRKPWGTDPALDTLGLAAHLIQDFLLMRDLYTPEADAEVISATKLEYVLPERVVSSVKPDVIFWLSESFFDTRIFKDVQTCDQTPFFCELARKNISGSISVPTFAGQTIRTEFELLTGVPMATVEKHHFPYMSLTNVPVNSIAWELRDQGYDTVAVHNHKRRFWRRPVALNNLGFQRWIGVEGMESAHRVGNYHADAVLTDYVIDLLEEPSAGKPQLVFAISMQAHGPYGKQPRLPNKQVAAIKVPEQLRAKNVRILQEYYFHLNSADNELRRLAAYVESRERPTMVLFFGDHLPGLAGVYGDLKFDNKLGPKKQNTPYVIFSNFPLQDSAPDNLDIATWQLAALTMKTGGILGDGAFAWFDVLYDELAWSPASTAECTIAACGSLLQFQYQQLAGPKHMHQ
jgi:phosphoglycerol transferase MdoB-like AlkP superfamily enzyme